MVLQTAFRQGASLLWPMSVLALTARQAQAKLFMNQEKALAKAFPEADAVERKTLFLTPEQARAVEEESRTRVDSSIVTYYVGKKGDTPLGTAFFSTRVVRTMPMLLMTVVKPDGRVAFVEVLAFYEPEDYLPRPSWLRQYQNKLLNDRLRIRRDIPNVTGASLTCQAINDGVRQTLALHHVIP